jgi:hypothetical protein
VADVQQVEAAVGKGDGAPGCPVGPDEVYELFACNNLAHVSGWDHSFRRTLPDGNHDDHDGTMNTMKSLSTESIVFIVSSWSS